MICPHADRCAGCPLLDLPEADQLAKKRERVTSAFAPYPSLASLAIPSVVAATPSLAYRTRAKWMTGPKGALGLYSKTGDHEVVDIPECRVATETVREVGEVVRTMLRRGSPSWLRSRADGGVVHAIDVRQVTDRGASHALVTLVVDEDRAPREDEARAVAEELSKLDARIVGVALNLHKARAPQVLGGMTRPLFGARDAIDDASGPPTIAAFGSFVQAHPAQARRIHEEIARFATSGGQKKPRVLDVYGGSGPIALALAAKGADVSLVESFAPAAQLAERAARDEKLSLRAYVGDAAHVLTSLARETNRFDLVVVNPPRRGVAVDARTAIAELRPSRLAYVSCEPASLARDLDHFARLGYQARSLQPFDMIPQTEEVETLALLERGELPSPTALFEDDEIVAMDKPPHEPTTPQGEHDVSLLARVRRMPGLADAVPIHRLDIGTSGVCLFARAPSFVSGWAKALGADDARKLYTAMAKGVTSPKGSIHRALRDGPKTEDARTRYKRLEVVGGHSLLEVAPDEGRTHQIRRHLAGLGHPLLGDARYGHAATNRFMEERFFLDRTFLHCSRIELLHPRTGERLVLRSALPGDLAAVQKKLAATTPPAPRRS